jgi:hypothetical protein
MIDGDMTHDLGMSVEASNPIAVRFAAAVEFEAHAARIERQP